MDRRNRLLSVHLLAVLLPCAVIGLLGYKWLRLERDAEARRGKDAAEVEAVRLRTELGDHLAVAAREVARKYTARAATQPPFALPPRPPEIVAAAYLFSPEGRLIYPAYEAAYRQAISDHQAIAATGLPACPDKVSAATCLALPAIAQPTAGQPGRKAWLLLHLGRLSLAERQYRAAELHAAEIFRCCAGARDEYGVPFALYAAAQIASAWEAQSSLQARFPQLASQIIGLLETGWIGHPRDLPDISALAKRAGNQPAASSLLLQAEQVRSRVLAHIETGRRLEKWITGSPFEGRSGSPMAVTTWWSEGRPQVVGLYRAEDANLLTVLFETDRLAAWIAARAAERGQFEAVLRAAGHRDPRATLQAAFLPEAPGFDLVLRARESDPATQQRRQALFAGALAAAVLLTLLVGYFALRDFSRELQLAGLRSNFVAGVTHELKTPLTSIRLLAETLRMGRARDPAVTDELLGTIVDESERLTRLLDNVLSFAKIEKGARAYQPAEISLPEAVNGALRRFQYVLKQGGFDLRHRTDGQRLRVYADADALTQALLNLLSNAVKYSGASREIHLAIEARGDEAEIRVTDRGIGIARSEQERIFESFYRVPEAARDTTGAGLGLALVRHFAEAHGGRLTVSSEPGKGSTFSLWLPLVKDGEGNG